MMYLIFIFASLVLLCGFFALTRYEAGRHMRSFAPMRIRLDQDAEHAKFILAHVDFGVIVREEAYRIARRITHTVACFSLQAVRTVEHILTRLVRYLRTRYAVDIQPRNNAREFVKTLSDFKNSLKDTRPDVPDIR